ncbi:MAG: tRNA-intron lyase [Candidatus Pacearchaeota archaeon]|nr:tRNA-intron lyase [Candidatus Pacearchaeota archaeon]MDE1848470.1 tRNA-intron lyase [Nanoarchaeota archaeon]
MERIQAYLVGEQVSSNSSEAFSLHEKSSFGEKKEGKVIYSPSEALFLVEKGKIEVLSSGKKISFDGLMKRFKKSDKKIQLKYPVFRDLREKGYVVKTALKFGAEFRIYEKGAKMGDKHSKWVAFTDYESKTFTWQEFSAKNRVAHSTKKKLLIAIVDEEGDITYYEVNWVKP